VRVEEEGGEDDWAEKWMLKKHSKPRADEVGGGSGSAGNGGGDRRAGGLGLISMRKQRAGGGDGHVSGERGAIGNQRYEEDHNIDKNNDNDNAKDAHDGYSTHQAYDTYDYDDESGEIVRAPQAYARDDVRNGQMRSQHGWEGWADGERDRQGQEAADGWRDGHEVGDGGSGAQGCVMGNGWDAHGARGHGGLDVYVYDGGYGDRYEDGGLVA
jgi:hypothetical protein